MKTLNSNKMTHLDNIKAMYQMIGAGKVADAFEQFYHPNVVMQELGEEPRLGKDTNREHGAKFMSMIKEFHGSEVLAITANENKTMVESWVDITFQNDIRVKTEQVAVQTWEDNLIIKEVFYHK
jgi:hypothetical protein